MDSYVFIFMGFIILIAYLSGMILLMKAKRDEPPKEKSSKKIEEVTQDQAYDVIQTLYNNQLITQKEYNQCVTMGLGLFKS